MAGDFAWTGLNTKDKSDSAAVGSPLSRVGYGRGGAEEAPEPCNQRLPLAVAPLPPPVRQPACADSVPLVGRLDTRRAVNTSVCTPVHRREGILLWDAPCGPRHACRAATAESAASVLLGQHLLAVHIVSIVHLGPPRRRLARRQLVPLLQAAHLQIQGKGVVQQQVSARG